MSSQSRRNELRRAWGKKNRARLLEQNKAWRLAHPEVYRSSKLKTMFGITLDEYNIMFLKQDGRCAICGRHQSELKRALDVDHDHITGEVRGLLCSNCNTALGKFHDDINVMRNAIIYMETRLQKKAGNNGSIS